MDLGHPATRGGQGGKKDSFCLSLNLNCLLSEKAETARHNID
jgi:hypothetical protein